MISVVYLAGDATSFVTHFIHQPVNIRRIERTTGLDMLQKIVKCHNPLLSLYRFSHMAPLMNSSQSVSELPPQRVPDDKIKIFFDMVYLFICFLSAKIVENIRLYSRLITDIITPIT